MFSKVVLILTGQKKEFHAGSRGCHVTQRLELNIGRVQINRVAREACSEPNRNQRKVLPGKLMWECNDLSMVRAHDIQTRVKGT